MSTGGLMRQDNGAQAVEEAARKLVRAGCGGNPDMLRRQVGHCFTALRMLEIQIFHKKVSVV